MTARNKLVVRKIGKQSVRNVGVRQTDSDSKRSVLIRTAAISSDWDRIKERATGPLDLQKIIAARQPDSLSNFGDRRGVLKFVAGLEESVVPTRDV